MTTPGTGAPSSDPPKAPAPRRSRRVFRGLVVLVVLVVLSGLGLAALLRWIEVTEAAWRDHVAAGRGVTVTLHQLEEAFLRRQGSLDDVFASGWDATAGGSPRREDPRSENGIEVVRWRGTGPATREAWLGAFTDWRNRRAWAEEGRFQLEWIHEQPRPDQVDAEFLIHLVGDDLEGRRFRDRVRFRGRFVETPDGWRLRALELEAGVEVAGSGRLARDEAGARGLVYTVTPDDRLVPGGPLSLRYQVIRHAYAGALTTDVDRDGFADVLLMGGGPLKLFRNRGDGTFEDITDPAGLAGLAGFQTGVFADFDGDGWPDLFLARYFGENVLFRSAGDGTFLRTACPGPDQVDAVSCLVAADFDDDGWMDLYLGRFIEARETIPDTFLYARNGPPNRMFRGGPGLAFTDETVRSGTGDTGLTASLSVGDYDRDGSLDLWCINDYGRNVLYRGRGDGTFEDATRRSGTLDIDPGMSAMWADYDNDGWLDFYISAIHGNQLWYSHPKTSWRFLAHKVRLRLEGVRLAKNTAFRDLIAHFGWGWDRIGQMSLAGNNLWRNQGDGTFVKTSRVADVQDPGWYWSSGFFDMDNDGFKDVYAVNGWITGEDSLELDFSGETSSDRPYELGFAYSNAFVGGSSWHGNERNVLYLNQGDGTFLEAATAWGMDSRWDGRGIAAADYDHDGDLDLVVSNYNRPAQLFVNRFREGVPGAAAHWLEVELVSRRGDRRGIGAQIHVIAGGRPRAGNVAAGEGYASQYTPVLHFGLGAETRVEAIRVHWPGGGTDEVAGPLSVDRRIRLIEGVGLDPAVGGS